MKIIDSNTYVCIYCTYRQYIYDIYVWTYAKYAYIYTTVRRIVQKSEIWRVSKTLLYRKSQ